MAKFIVKIAVVALLVAGFIAAVVLAFIRGAEIIQKFTAESIAIGTVDDVEKDETVIATFDLGKDYTFPTEDVKKSIDPIEFNGALNEYVVRFNGHACDVVSVSAGRMHIQTKILFDNLEGQFGGSCTFDIDVQFASLATSLVVKVSADNNTAYEYLNQYVYNNGLKFEVCLKEDISNG